MDENKIQNDNETQALGNVDKDDLGEAELDEVLERCATTT